MSAEGKKKEALDFTDTWGDSCLSFPLTDGARRNGQDKHYVGGVERRRGEMKFRAEEGTPNNTQTQEYWKIRQEKNDRESDVK